MRVSDLSLDYFRDLFRARLLQLRDQAAAQIPVGCDGLIFHPYLNGELTPYADPSLCGSFTGVRATHTRAHFTRAVLEGVALSLLHSKQTLTRLGIPPGREGTLIGGGAKGPLWRQITTDVLGMTLRHTVSSDSSLGSAMLAGVSVGVFSSPEDAAQKCIRTAGITEPNPENTEKYARLMEEYIRIHDALAPIYQGRNL